MKRILIIDDDYLVRDMLERLMRKASYDVETAEDGNRALRLHRDNPVDLVITDIIMPEKEGLETITEFRKSPSGVKIIAISGGGRIGPSSYLRMAKLLGADRTFAKPVDTAQLLSAVEELTALPPLKSISFSGSTPASQGR
jgi:YesN/AraC family two-component response regulator